MVKIFKNLIDSLMPGMMGRTSSHLPDDEGLAEKTAPQFFAPENNRNVAWIECGDPKGFPIFYAHGCPGSRMELLFFDQKARKYGFRIIVFERPGFGRSDFIDGYPLLAFAEDLEKLADALHIKKFGLLGWSSGGPPVLAAAHRMPGRAMFVFSVSGYTDFAKFEDADRLMAEHKLYGPKLFEESPRLFDRVVEMIRWTDLHLPNFYFKLAKEEMSPPDRKILADPRVAALFTLNQEESMVAGARGICQDLTTQWEPWDFDIKQIRVPAHIFQGKRDSFVPWQFAQHLASTIPNASLNLYNDRGHLFILEASAQDALFRQAKRIMR